MRKMMIAVLAIVALVTVPALFAQKGDAAAGNEAPLRALFGEHAAALDDWLARWRAMFGTVPGVERARAMAQVNPMVIPRNHLVEQALEAASDYDDLGPFERLLNARYSCRAYLDKRGVPTRHEDLDQHELIKVKVAAGDRDLRDEWIGQLIADMFGILFNMLPHLVQEVAHPGLPCRRLVRCLSAIALDGNIRRHDGLADFHRSALRAAQRRCLALFFKGVAVGEPAFMSC